MTFDLPTHRPDILSFLRTRRSNLAKVMTGPGPSAAELSDMLTIAARVPDHRKLAPWRFIVFEGEARASLGEHLATAFKKDNPDLSEDRIVFEQNRLLRAPTVVAVISAPVLCPRGTPEWEQILSSGVVCYNLCLAAQATGYGAQWLTEWYSYHPEIHQALALQDTEKIAGFIYIGTSVVPATERARPDVSTKIQHFT